MADPTEAALAGLASAQELAADTRDMVHQLHQLVAAAARPPALHVIELTQTTPRRRIEERMTALSIGVLNPTAIKVLIGVQGGSAHPGARGIPVPAGSVMVLPVPTEDLELGADTSDAATVAALAAGDAVAYVLRFETVQPFYFARYA